MSLILRVPRTHAPERAWVWGILLGNRLGQAFRLEPWDGSVTRLEGPGPGWLEVDDDLFARPEGTLLQPDALPPAPAPVWDLRGTELDAALDLPSMPVPYGRGGLDITGEGIRLHADVAGTCFFLLSRMEEVVLPDRDLHGRFPSEASWSVRVGVERRPLVEEWVSLLRVLLQRLWPGLAMPAPRYALRPTHDIDWPTSTAGLPVRRVATILAKDLLWRRQPGLFTRRLGAALFRRHEWDPFRSHRWLMAQSERRGLRSTFYFMACPEPGPLDGQYTMDEPWAQAMVREVAEGGHEVGLHPSLETRDRLSLLQTECVRLSAVLRKPVAGARQHYLKWRPRTWADYEAAGLAHDASVGFSDRMGFRCGTGDDFPAFDLERRQPLALQVRPLHFMDTSFYATEKELPKVRAAFAGLAEMAGRLRRHGGTLNLLWHNNFLNGREEQAAYLEALAAAGASC